MECFISIYGNMTLRRMVMSLFESEVEKVLDEAFIRAFWIGAYNSPLVVGCGERCGCRNCVGMRQRFIEECKKELAERSVDLVEKVKEASH